MTTGYIWDIKRYALHDGPGIRTTVFFLGCPLRCLWCCNPESQSFTPRVWWIKEHCLACGLCEEICPHNAICHDEAGRRMIRLELCTLCGDCAAQCPGQALNISGRKVSVDQVLAEVAKDAGFFARSGGGLTLSGGEPLAQADFANELLRRYKQEEKGPHAAVETSGRGAMRDLERLARYVDLFLYDIKHMDPAKHLELTGADNHAILRNARSLAAAGAKMVIRFPLIPGCNDDQANIMATAEFARSLPGVYRLDILPYHRLGEPKYSRLGMEYALNGAVSPSKERIATIKRQMEETGLEVRVGG